MKKEETKDCLNQKAAKSVDELKTKYKAPVKDKKK